MGNIQALSQRFDVVKSELRSGLYNQRWTHTLNPANVGAYEGAIAEKVNHTWNPSRTDINRFDCVSLKD